MDVHHEEIIGWRGSRVDLWNHAELAETRGNATVAREFEVALPVELSSGEQVTLARRFARWLHNRYGVAVDVCLHNLDGSHPHVHCLCTTRTVEKDELGPKAPMEWDGAKRRRHGLLGRRAELRHVRSVWADVANAALARAGRPERVDHRSHDEQFAGQEFAPVPTKYIGPAASRLEASGTPTEIGEFNRMVLGLREVEEELQGVQAEIAALEAMDASNDAEADDEVVDALQPEVPHLVSEASNAQDSPATVNDSPTQDGEVESVDDGVGIPEEEESPTDADLWDGEPDSSEVEPDGDATDGDDPASDHDRPEPG